LPCCRISLGSNLSLISRTAKINLKGKGLSDDEIDIGKSLPLICRGGFGVKESISATIAASGAIILFLCAGVFSQEAVQVQPSTDGTMEASVTQAKVRENVFSVKLTLKNVTNRDLEPEIAFKDFFVTNIKDMKKYFPLHDAQGNVLAGPQERAWQGGIFKNKIHPGEMRTIWVDFPVPTESAKTVDLFMPGMIPFEGVKINRSQG
jgi:hypothetical protein